MDGVDLVPDPLVVLQKMETGAILMNTASGECFELNPIGTEVWTRLTGGERLEAIVQAIAAAYAAEPSAVKLDVDALIADLARHGLLTGARR